MDAARALAAELRRTKLCLGLIARVAALPTEAVYVESGVADALADACIDVKPALLVKVRAIRFAVTIASQRAEVAAIIGADGESALFARHGGYLTGGYASELEGSRPDDGTALATAAARFGADYHSAACMAAEARAELPRFGRKCPDCGRLSRIATTITGRLDEAQQVRWSCLSCPTAKH